MRVQQFGGGVQSTAMLVLIQQGVIACDHILFDHVGEDSEAPETLEFIREIAIPWASEHGIEIHVLPRTRADGSTETVLERIKREGGKSHVIPVKLSGGMQGGRSCTRNFKIDVSGKWLKEHGASEANKATVLMGISLDEIHRATSKKEQPYETVAYPLLDLKLRRVDCENLIRTVPLSPAHAAHLREIVDTLDWYIGDQLRATDCTMMPVPPPSACWFCPARPMHTWETLRAQRPERFDAVAKLEQWFIDREAAQGKAPVYFSNAGVPITRLADPGVALLPLFDRGDEDCDSGRCMT